MSQLALYRKYRPQKFEEVHGQDHIVKVLEGSIELKRVAHAYLFAGTRGTGKTTIARIFARALGVSDNDTYEIDAASNRGIDDIREIRDGVSTLPFESPYKVYIIDEVHMLTKEAFNALLKTLEEPPAHAIFILATTETDKIPETVISRCQVFTFRKPSKDVLKNLLTTVAKKEGFTLEQGVADLIALLGDGAFRDTLGTLQKVISSSKDKKITLAEVELVTGAPRGTIVNDFITALAEGNKVKALQAIATASAAQVNMTTFSMLVLEKSRAVLLLKYAPDMKTQIEEAYSTEDIKAFSKITEMADSRLNAAVLAELLSAHIAIPKAAVDTLPLELAVMKVLDK